MEKCLSIYDGIIEDIWFSYEVDFFISFTLTKIIAITVINGYKVKFF